MTEPLGKTVVLWTLVAFALVDAVGADARRARRVLHRRQHHHLPAGRACR